MTKNYILLALLSAVCVGVLSFRIIHKQPETPKGEIRETTETTARPKQVERLEIEPKKEPQRQIEPLPKETADHVEKAREKPGQITGTEINGENVLNGVNQIRYDKGLDILTRNEVLDRIAETKLADMRQYDYWAHTNPITGSNPWHWFEIEGYKYRFAGENLARNFNTVQQTLQAWQESPKHFDNIIKKEFKHTGIATDGKLVVQVFSD